MWSGSRASLAPSCALWTSRPSAGTREGPFYPVTMLAPLSIQVQHLYKSFAAGNSTWTPFKQLRHQEKRISVLEDISFEVHRGEVYGVVGTNGAGKSTLLKLIAGIYRIDRGQIRVGGRVAPLIELGVGFRPDLPARPNILLNGVMMGLSPAESKRRTDAILEFAELEEFDELQLKNYSSGMRGRLGFSIMTHVDSDVLLVDEIMAVGDKAFRDKCGDVIAGMRSSWQHRGSGQPRDGLDHPQLRSGAAHPWPQGRALGQPTDVADRYLAVNSRTRWKAAADGDGAADAAEVVELGFAAGRADGERKVPARSPIDVEAVRRAAAAAALPGGQVHDPGRRRKECCSWPRPARSSPVWIGSAAGSASRPGSRTVWPRAVSRSCAGSPSPTPSRSPRGEGEPQGDGVRSAGRWLTFTIDSPDELGSVLSVDTEINVDPAEVDVDACRGTGPMSSVGDKSLELRKGDSSFELRPRATGRSSFAMATGRSSFARSKAPLPSAGRRESASGSCSGCRRRPISGCVTSTRVFGYIWALDAAALDLRDHLRVPAKHPELRRQDRELRRAVDDQHHPVPVLSGGDHSRAEIARLQGGPGAKDAISPNHHPALDVADRLDAARVQPAGRIRAAARHWGSPPEPGWLLLPFLGGGHGGDRDRGFAVPIGGVRADARRRPDLGRDLPGALLGLADPLSNRAGA